MSINPAALKAALDGDIENAIVASTPGGIEAQEAEGQRKLTSRFTQLPADMNHGRSLELGFKFGERDGLFIPVEAPEGWELRPTDHSMWSDIVDDKGVKRGSVFYKAAFYDERAFGSWDD